MCGEEILEISDPTAGFDQKNNTKYLSFNNREDNNFWEETIWLCEDLSACSLMILYGTKIYKIFTEEGTD